MKFNIKSWKVKQKQINNKIVKSIEIVRKYLKKERLIAISLLSRILGLIIVLVVSPIGTIQVQAGNQIKSVESEKIIETNLQLDVQKSIPIYLEEKTKLEIKPGESNYQIELREVVEANRRSLEVQKTRQVISREISRSPSYNATFSEKRALAQEAASKYGIDWKILEAVWEVESGKSWDRPVKSYAGATGPMQFMPSTFRGYAQDGNGDGKTDITSAQDAVYSAANMLAQRGAASGDVDQALFAYNHAQWYVNKVKKVADSIVE